VSQSVFFVVLFMSASRTAKDRRTAILMILPSIILLAVFVYGFIGQTMFNSLTDWGQKAALAVNAPVNFVGLKNYQDLFTGLQHYRFRVDLVNTIFFTLMFLGACLLLGLFMAILLDQRVRGESVFRTVFLFPMALSFVVTGTVWRWIFAPKGGINVLPTMFGGPAWDFQWFIDTRKAISFTWQDGLVVLMAIILMIFGYFALGTWLDRKRLRTLYILVGAGLFGAIFGNSLTSLPEFVAPELHGLNVAMIAIMIAATWQMAGYTMAIYLAGLRGIPEELREAARVDGCNEVQVYRYVVLPLLQPITLSAAIILGHISLKIFDLIYVMAGADWLPTDVPGINMYITSFRANNFSLGSAIAVIMLLMVAVIIVPYLYTQLRGDTQ